MNFLGFGTCCQAGCYLEEYDYITGKYHLEGRFWISKSNKVHLALCSGTAESALEVWCLRHSSTFQQDQSGSVDESSCQSFLWKCFRHQNTRNWRWCQAVNCCLYFSLWGRQKAWGSSDLSQLFSLCTEADHARV